jgi:hypothetical protein
LVGVSIQKIIATGSSSFEFKWKGKSPVTVRAPKGFNDNYRGSIYKIIDKTNYQTFLELI